MFSVVGRGIGGDNKLEFKRVGNPEKVVSIESVDFAGENGVFKDPGTFAGTAPFGILGKEWAFDKLPDPGASIPAIPDYRDIGFVIFVASGNAPGPVAIVAFQGTISVAFSGLENQEPVF